MRSLLQAGVAELAGAARLHQHPVEFGFQNRAVQQGLGHVLLDHALAHAELYGDLLVGQAVQVRE